MGLLEHVVEGFENDHDREVFHRGMHHAKEKYEEVIREALHHLEEGEDHEAKHILHEALVD